MQIIYELFSQFLHNYSLPLLLGHNSSAFPMARESIHNGEEVNPQWQKSESPMTRKPIHNDMRGNPQVHRCMGAWVHSCVLSAEVS